MFNNLTDRLSNSFKALQGKNKLSESNIKDAIRQVRRAFTRTLQTCYHYHCWWNFFSPRSLQLGSFT
jgi:hypothetical protein